MRFISFCYTNSMRTFFQQAIPCWVVFIIALGLAGCAGRLSTVTFDGSTYRLTSEQPGGAAVYQDAAGKTLRVELSDTGARVTADGQTYLVSGTVSEMQVTFPDGRVLWQQYESGPSGSSSAGGTAPGVEASMTDWNRVSDLHAIVFGSATQATSTGGLARIVFGLLALAAGVLSLVNPHLAWTVLEGGWRFKNVEPSDAYVVFSRIGGVVLIAAGVLLMVGVIG